jgi:outer membrane lipoprotein-sorting protein
MKKYLFTAIGYSLILAIFMPPGIAGETEAKPLDVDEIVNRTNRAAYYQGKDGRARVSMVITDSQGRERNRKFAILRRDVPDPADPGNDSYTGDQKSYVYFQRPADVNKMVFMVWKQADQGTDDDRWLYLPALDLVKRIAGTEKRTSFVGSDFFYEDVTGRNINDDIHELEKTTDNYYVLKNTPRDPDSVEFKNYTIWVHKDTFLPVKIEYFDKNGEKYREYSALDVETIQGFPTVTKASMKNLKTKSETVMDYEDVKYDLGLPDDIFTERYLRKPPREYLR